MVGLSGVSDSAGFASSCSAACGVHSLDPDPAGLVSTGLLVVVHLLSVRVVFVVGTVRPLVCCCLLVLVLVVGWVAVGLGLASRHGPLTRSRVLG